MITDDGQGDPRPTGDGPRPRLSITESPTGARVISVGATLDATAAAELRREASALLARSLHPLVVDLTAVRAAEPAAAGVLRDLAHEAGEADIDLRVARDPGAPAVARAVLDDETLFEIHPTLDAALRAVDADARRPSPRLGRPPTSGDR